MRTTPGSPFGTHAWCPRGRLMCIVAKGAAVARSCSFTAMVRGRAESPLPSTTNHPMGVHAALRQLAQLVDCSQRRCCGRGAHTGGSRRRRGEQDLPAGRHVPRSRPSHKPRVSPTHHSPRTVPVPPPPTSSPPPPPLTAALQVVVRGGVHLQLAQAQEHERHQAHHRRQRQAHDDQQDALRGQAARRHGCSSRGRGRGGQIEQGQGQGGAALVPARWPYRLFRTRRPTPLPARPPTATHPCRTCRRSSRCSSSTASAPRPRCSRTRRGRCTGCRPSGTRAGSPPATAPARGSRTCSPRAP
jgi:hypothetical protein